MKRLQLIARALPLVFYPLSRQAVQPLRIKRPALDRPRVIELDGQENAVRPPATFANVGLFLEDSHPLLYSAEALRAGSVHTFSVKKKNSSISAMKIGLWSKKVARTSFGEEVKAAAKSVAKMRKIIDVTLTASGALQLEVKPAFQV